MKLEKFRFGNKKKVTITSIMAIIIILLVGIIIYQSYALYEDKKTFNVLNGTIPTFGEVTGEIQLAYTIDGQTNTGAFPKKESDYIVKSVKCENGVEAEWNNGLWGIINVKNNNNVEQIKCTIDFTKAKVYGIKRALNSSSSEWVRTDASVGKVANAQFGTVNVSNIRNDFDNIYPWSDIKSYNYNTSTKSITAWFGSSDFKFDGTNGEVLTYIPEFYYKRVQDGGYEYIQISKRQKEGFTKSEAFSVGRYTMSGSSAGVHSKSGVEPFTNDTITNYRNYAKNLGSGFGQMDYHYFIIQMLYLVEYADYNSQAKLGVGNSNNTGAVQSGGCNILEMKSGNLSNDGKHSMIYRGIEDIYGNIFQFVDGINSLNNQIYICYNQANYVSDKYDGCYNLLGYTKFNSNGHITQLGYDSYNPIMAFPTNTNETNDSIISDYYYQTSGKTIMAIGGFWTANNNNGLWDMAINISSSYKNNYAGARLIKIS